MNSFAMSFPKGEELQKILQLEHDSELNDLFALSLFGPLEEILSRPGKSLRSQLVHLGYSIGCHSRSADPCAVRTQEVEKAAAVLELIHAGSLIVDDIQDGSLQRRGRPSLHQLHGIPIALNAGNWLYFLPLQQIERMDVPERIRQAALHECHRMMLRAHFGQALDVGVRVSSLAQERVPSVTMAALELKSGVLTGFALRLGALLAEASEEILQALDSFGRKFGVALQMFDDVGNLTSRSNPLKQAEDLKLQRLTFLTTVAARTLSAVDYQKFLSLTVALPDSRQNIIDLLDSKGVLAASREEAVRKYDEALCFLTTQIQIKSQDRAILDELKQKLMSSYE